eukprot:Skav215928  [mRNA]  locus=scaffold226:306252:310784:+ [translate_table: standard]
MVRVLASNGAASDVEKSLAQAQYLPRCLGTSLAPSNSSASLVTSGAMAMDPEDDWALEKAAQAIELPLTMESVEATRQNQEGFSHEKGHDILLRCWATMQKMLKTQGGSFDAQCESILPTAALGPR